MTTAYDNLTDTQRELYLYASNTAAIWRNVEHSYRNLERKQKRGVFDPSLAVKLLEYNATDAAKACYKEHGSSGWDTYSIEPRPMPNRWHDMFAPADRTAVAAALLENFTDERAAGNSWLD